MGQKKMDGLMGKYKYRNVTISGLPGAGSSTLGRSLAKKTGWRYYSGGDFMRAYAVSQGLLEEKSQLHHDATVYNDEFDRKVDYEVRRTAKEESGNVMDAWLSGFMALGVEGTLKVLVECGDDAVRVDRIVNRDEVGVMEAKKHIFEREEKNLKKWQRMYKREWDEWVVKRRLLPASASIDFWISDLYDLVIDTFSHSKEEALELVMKELGGSKDREKDLC